jgi:urease accessory protein UreE
MAAVAIFAEPSKGYNLAIYQPIWMKFETQEHIYMPSRKKHKTRSVVQKNKKATIAILLNYQKPITGN